MTGQIMVSQEAWDDAQAWKAQALNLLKERDESTYPTINTLRTERDDVLYPFVMNVTAALGLPNKVDTDSVVAAIKKLGGGEFELVTEPQYRKKK